MEGTNAPSKIVKRPRDQPPPKRRRVALACQSCRERKIRCDGARPVCGSCQRRENCPQQCEYLVIGDTAKYQTERAYVRMLQDQISTLQDSIHKGDHGPTEPLFEEAAPRLELQQTTSTSDNLSPFLPQEEEEEVQTRPLSGYSHSQTAFAQYGSPSSLSLPNSIGAMGAIVPDMSGVETGEQYYGQSSLVSMIQQCTNPSPEQNMRDSRYQSPPSVTLSTTSHSRHFFSAHPATSSLFSNEYLLPPRQVADWLIDIYFANNHVFYPWVQKEAFLASYNLLWSNSNQDSRKSLPDVGLGGRNCHMEVFYCALNAMFAIACEFSDMPAQTKRKSSLTFYERMQSLINIDILDSGSLAHIQTLLLVAMYLQCTPYPRRCWNVVGMAYRMSIGLGLHVKKRYSDALNPLEREVRWREWCACVQMDVIASMTMGRPAITSFPCDVPLPSPVSDECLAESEARSPQPARTISSNQFFHENMKLIGILGRILATIYQNTELESKATQSHIPLRDLQSVIEIDHALEIFESSIHSSLWWSKTQISDEDTTTTCTLKRQSNVLHARYLHLRLLLHRPGFTGFCSKLLSQGEQENSPETNLNVGSCSWSAVCQKHCAVRCVESACDLINSLSRATKQDATGAWWYGVFYLVSAGIVLITSHASGVSFDENRNRQEAAWDQCLTTLGNMATVHQSARDYAMALSELKTRSRSISTQANNKCHADVSAFMDMGNSSGPNRPHEALDQANLQQNDCRDVEFSQINNILSPFWTNWDTGLDDIMFPAHLLQQLEDGVLPSLF